ncbi:hypothetical protein NQZ79_g6867 [Umbelopsis isabellina]|nr:hypothetical protein NQZ79_g6867 [Umbelopsis isabellina]
MLIMAPKRNTRKSALSTPTRGKTASTASSVQNSVSRSATPQSVDSTGTSLLNLLQQPRPFKNKKYAAPKKARSLKQLLTQEKQPDFNVDFPTYQNIESPPSVRPLKKYCDITGLEARYTDPKTGLRYHNAEIFQFIKGLGVSSVQAYLGSRNAAVVLK